MARTTGAVAITDAKRTTLIHELAVAERTQAQIAELVGVSQQYVSEFRKKNLREIDARYDEIIDAMDDLWIKNQEARLKELQFDARMLRGWRSPAAVEARLKVFKHIAEELNQMPVRTQIAVIPVQHIIEGIDMQALE